MRACIVEDTSRTAHLLAAMIYALNRRCCGSIEIKSTAILIREIHTGEAMAMTGHMYVAHLCRMCGRWYGVSVYVSARSWNFPEKFLENVLRIVPGSIGLRNG
jgi:hypothetical protein